MIVLLLGPPGVGKGTQSDNITHEFNINKISTGDILRDAVKNETEVGLEAKQYMVSGELVPDSIILKIIDVRMKDPDCSNGFILDGFPRTIPQAEGLDSILEKAELKIDKVLCLKADEENIINRMTSRRVCKTCGKVYNTISLPPAKDGICDNDDTKLIQRTDDKEETIRNRFDVYRKQTEPLINYYKNKNLLFEVDSNGSIDEIKNNIFNLLRG